MKRATIADAPAVLNMNDKAMWVLGYNAAAERATLTREQIVAGLDAARKVEQSFDFGDGFTAAERESDRVFAFRAAVFDAAHVSGVLGRTT